MRYYEIWEPNTLNEDGQPPLVPLHGNPVVTTNLRSVKNLPEGTRVLRIITERDGTLSDVEDIPVVNGKPQINGRGKQRAKMYNL